MNETILNSLRWIVVISFLLLPPYLVRHFVDVAPTLRVVIYCLLIIVLTSYGLYLALRKGDIVADMPIGQELKTGKSRRIVALLFRGLASFMVIAGIYRFANIAPSIASYVLREAPAVNEVHTITQINSPALPGAFYIYMSILTDNKHYLSFTYPNEVLQVGHRYIFTILPNSNFVINANEVY
jgi:uncharacterized oligopeptide transporter (OPT) family protein